MNAFNQSELGALLLDREVAPQEMAPNELLDVVMSRHFGTDYQPIVDVQSSEMLGYEARARFWARGGRPIDADKLRMSLRKNPLLLFHLELELKKQQIADFPGEGWLMLDLDMDSFFAGGEGTDNPFLNLFREHAWSDREIIINVVQNHTMQETLRTQHMMDLLQHSGTSVALEDAGLSWGMFSLSAFLDAAMVKFSSRALLDMDGKAAQAMVDWLVGAARKIGVQTVMTGVDTCAALEWARKMRIDCVQGRLFSKQAMQVH
ncbi:EAL domain-containing protein [Methylobacillus flagellatus]|uniref:Diguanylate phosphodiesterase (EAL domain) n=1 Tax=Methylobacillus flagellatus (strain ATCC 51484 / DSM 6875 / VKM B-1610 / KT) TaxID=265072 RepID=Q1H4D1_METFK|nr:EAL domain-containing protein [Methylobacillus flagellatus]ABE48656.1 diguanylate phosphodiesterase (EAL domain) [Methylobacillus flagellatus KT]